MIKVPTTEELQQKELQKQAYVAQTRFSLAQQFMNTLMTRKDLDMEATDFAGLALFHADDLMLQMGMITKEETPPLPRDTTDGSYPR